VPGACIYYVINLPYRQHSANPSTVLSSSLLTAIISFPLQQPSSLLVTSKDIFSWLLRRYVMSHLQDISFEFHVCLLRFSAAAVVATALRLGWRTLRSLDFCPQVYSCLGFF
jgi:hypothetical protein